MPPLEPLLLSVSIYYSKYAWHSLIKKCIYPFYLSLGIENKPYLFFIFFNSYRGNNIRIVLYCHNTLRADWQKFEDGIQKFLQKNPSKTKKAHYPPRELFMNIPNNFIIKEVLNDFPSNTFIQNDFQDVRNYLSEVLINKFSWEKVDIASQFTLSLYLHLMIVKALSLKQSIDFQKLIIECLSDEKMNLKYTDSLDRVTLERLYVDNKEILMELIEAVLNESTGEIIFNENEGQQLFNNSIEKANAPIIASMHLFHIINEHLGFSNQQSLVILQLLAFENITY